MNCPHCSGQIYLCPRCANQMKVVADEVLGKSLECDCGVRADFHFFAVKNTMDGVHK